MTKTHIENVETKGKRWIECFFLHLKTLSVRNISFVSVEVIILAIWAADAIFESTLERLNCLSKIKTRLQYATLYIRSIEWRKMCWFYQSPAEIIVIGLLKQISILCQYLFENSSEAEMEVSTKCNRSHRRIYRIYFQGYVTMQILHKSEYIDRSLLVTLKTLPSMRIWIRVRYINNTKRIIRDNECDREQC